MQLVSPATVSTGHSKNRHAATIRPVSASPAIRPEAGQYAGVLQCARFRRSLVESCAGRAGCP